MASMTYYCALMLAMSLVMSMVSGFGGLTKTTKSLRSCPLGAHSTDTVPMTTSASSRNSMKKSVGMGLSALLVSAQAARAANVAESSLADSKKAAETIKEALAKVVEMEKAGTDYEAIGKLLGEDCFANFADNAFVLTKSSVLTPDDRIALGTIKRYGLVADAIIMVGGLSEALRAGGIKVAGGGGGYKDQAAIEEDDEDEDDAPKKVDDKEVKKYIKLVKGAFEDISKITNPILAK